MDLNEAILSVVLNEAFVNLIGERSIDEKRKWADRVWAMLEVAYAPIGGIKGTGFTDKEDMIQNIPFWKIYHQQGTLVAVIMYKDRAGRKGVAYGTDGSKKGKKILADVMKADLKVSWGELSKAALSFIMKHPWNLIGPSLMKPSQVAKQLPTDTITPLTPAMVKDLEAADQKIYAKFKDKLGPYFYVREIGGGPKLKVSLGTAEKTII